MFKIISEGSVAAGIRRVEAITGKNCEEAIYTLEDTIRDIRAFFNNAKDLRGVIAKYIDDHEGMKKDIEKYQQQALERTLHMILEHKEIINGVTVVKATLPIEAAQAKDLVFKVKNAIEGSLVCVIGSTGGGKPLLSVMLSEDMVKDHNLHAGQMVREAAKLIQGGGGGQPHYASAGGKNLEGIGAAVEKVVELARL